MAMYDTPYPYVIVRLAGAGCKAIDLSQQTISLRVTDLWGANIVSAMISQVMQPRAPIETSPTPTRGAMHLAH